MCGIFAVVGDKKNDASQTVLQGLKKLEYRGYDSWGIAVKPKNSPTLRVDKHVGKIGEAKTNLPNGTIAIGHTRWATHGGVTDENAHPHLDCSGKIAVIHNGIVENWEELKKSLSKSHKFKSQTDTEVVVHLVEELAKKLPFEEAARRAFLKLKGLNAFIFLKNDGQIVAVKSGSPMVVGLGE